MLDFQQSMDNDDPTNSGANANVGLEPTMGQAFSAAWNANAAYNEIGATSGDQYDFIQQKLDSFRQLTGHQIPNPMGADPAGRTDLLADARSQFAKRQAEATSPDEAAAFDFPTDQQIVQGGLALARQRLAKEQTIEAGPQSLSSEIGTGLAGLASSFTDPINAIAMATAPEGGGLLLGAFRMAGIMGAAQTAHEALTYGQKEQINPQRGIGSAAKAVAEAAGTGFLFGAGHALGAAAKLGPSLGAAAGGALAGGLFGGVPGAISGAAAPLAGAAIGGIKAGIAPRVDLGALWRKFSIESPDAAAAQPLAVRDAGTVAEKAGDLQAQNPLPGVDGEAAHIGAVGKTESDLLSNAVPQVPPEVDAIAAQKRGTVFYPGGSVDVRYGLRDLGDLTTSHDLDFRVNRAYPPELQPRDRSSVAAREQVQDIYSKLQPERFAPNSDANMGPPVVGPDGVVESGNGRTLALAKAYAEGGDRAAAYKGWLSSQGYDPSGMDRPVLVANRDTPMSPEDRAAFAHSTTGSGLRLNATEQAMSDARALDDPTIALNKSPDVTAASNRDFVRAFVSKLPQTERGEMLTGDGGLSQDGVKRIEAAMTARAYGDADLITRAFSHPEPNIKAIAGALTDASGEWAKMRDAATRGDTPPGSDITPDLVSAVKSIMRARDEGKPVWEILNQGDMFHSDTSQMAAKLFFRDGDMRRALGRDRIADNLTTLARDLRSNQATSLFGDMSRPAAEVLNDNVARATALENSVRMQGRDAGELFQHKMERYAEIKDKGIVAPGVPAAPASEAPRLPAPAQSPNVVNMIREATTPEAAEKAMLDPQVEDVAGNELTRMVERGDNKIMGVEYDKDGNSVLTHGVIDTQLADINSDLDLAREISGCNAGAAEAAE